MRLSRHHFASKIVFSADACFLAPLLSLGLAWLLVGASSARLWADDPEVDVPASAPVTSTAVPAANAADASTDNSQFNPQSDQGTLPPDNTQPSQEPQVPNIPLLPAQAANPYQPFSLTPTTLNAQAPQITSPSLYTTGTNDISQVSTNTALLNAFSTPSIPGFTSSEQEGGYSHPPIERILLGPIEMKAALVTNAVYDDNLFGSNGQNSGNINQNNNNNNESKSDLEYSATPAVLFTYGEQEGQRGYASLIYSPTIMRYVHNTSQNDVNQNVAFNAQYAFQRLTLNLSETYAQVTGINLDSNTRTTQTSNSVSFGGNYLIDPKLTLNVQLQYINTSFADPGGGQQQNSNVGNGGNTYSINTSLSYSYSDKLSFGPNFNFGVDKPQDNAQDTYEQVTMGVTYQPRPKFNFYLQGGVELRQYDDSNNNNNNSGNNQSNSGDEVDPIFSAGVNYLPFDSTTLSLSASQTIHSSDTGSGQTATSTGISVSASQRFFQRLYLGFNFNYNHSDYNNGSTGPNDFNGTNFDASTSDNYSYRTSLSINPTAWSTAALYYQYSDNESDNSSDSYHDNQIGLSLSAQF
jgi:hypothetical protein